MKFKVMAFLVAMAAAVPAFAQQAGPTTDLAKLEGGVFTVDKGHAKILFSYSHFGYSTSYGLFTDFDAKLTFDPKAPTSSTLEATINLDGIETMVAKLNEHLKTPDFFDTAKFPSASFKSTKITVISPTTGTVTGDLTLHGVTKPVTLDVTFNGGGTNMAKKYDLGFNATGHVKRSDFGLGAYVPMVGDDIALTISAEFNRVQ
ncbi:YceI family protein [Telmatospirillum siberiense]|uniref:Polyisoprenoid-binding protein n=1 Tax=Telmatospirillum siberiense TaxID=382514 RepID=A0A2N3PUW6_9PROT|nr:YceI family protein [Telmatospirillum siberiense]PKU24188.1 polyisoprenoid-binding protein [Telmatospirillum siberiense]